MLNAAPLGRGGHHQAAGDRAIATIATLCLGAKLLLGNPLEGLGIAKAPAGQVAAVEQAFKAGFGGERVAVLLNQSQCRQHGGQGPPPFLVAYLVGMQHVGEFFGLRVPLGVGEQCPGIDQGHLGFGLHQAGQQGVDFLDFLGGALLARRAGKDLADHHGEIGAVFLQGRDEQAEVRRNLLGSRLLFQVVGPGQHDHGGRLQGQDIAREPQQHSAGGVAADAAVGDFQPRPGPPQVVAPALGDRIAQEDDGAAIGFKAFGPGPPALIPEVAEPVVAADGSLARETIVGGGQFELGPRLVIGPGTRHEWGAQERAATGEQAAQHQSPSKSPPNSRSPAGAAGPVLPGPNSRWHVVWLSRGVTW